MGYAKFSTDADGVAIKSTIKFQADSGVNEFGICQKAALSTHGLLLTLSEGTATDVTVEVVVDPDHMVALGYLDQSMGDLTGDFEGYFALEFTDETGDTWMTESIAVTSTTVAHATDGSNAVSATSDILALN